MKRLIVVFMVCGAVGMMQALMAQEVVKRMTVAKIDREISAADSIPVILDVNNVGFQSIDQLNWPQFSYRPEVEFRMAYTASSILIHFKVAEKSVRAVADKDNGKVYEDSCVEFFVQPDPNQPIYYNLEFNCIGTLLIQGGAPGNRSFANADVLAHVKRWSSLGTMAFAEKKGDVTWELTAIIPFTTFFKHQMASLDGKMLKANFYKCGYKLSNRHYLSWNPIHLPNPQFHAPAFFGYLDFEWNK